MEKKGVIKAELQYNDRIDLILTYYVDSKIVAIRREKTFEEEETAKTWQRLWDNDEFNVGADTSLLDDRCQLFDVCPIESGIEFDCPMICMKHNCGAVLVRCSECHELYYERSGCWQWSHNEPTRCLCQ